MKYFLSTLLSVILLNAFAQTEAPAPKDSLPPEFRKYALIYNLSKKYNDSEMTKMALYNLYAMNPSVAILDSLALLYYENEQYASAAISAQDASTYNPDDMLATEIAALSFDNLGVATKAVPFYEKMYLENGNLGTLYRITFLQYNLKRYEESTNNADIMIENPQSDSTNLYFPLGNNQNQLVTLKAAAIRLKGMIAEAKGNKEEALALYNKALGLVPEFKVLKEQIAELNKKEK